ncbi:MAG: hypothetical protein MHPSP_004676, partial [Paramarteilia canceri]
MLSKCGEQIRKFREANDLLLDDRIKFNISKTIEILSQINNNQHGINCNKLKLPITKQKTINYVDMQA